MSRENEPLDHGFERTSQDISLRNIPSASGYDSVRQPTEHEDGFENDVTASLDPNASAVDPSATVSALPKHIPYSSAPSLLAQEAPLRSQSTGPRPGDGAEQQQFQEIDPSPKQLSTLVSKYYHNWWFWELAGAILSAICILAVVILANNINKTLLSAWKVPLNPRPSTMISIFITIAKTAMLLPVSEGLSQLKWLYFWVGRSKYRQLRDIEAFENASRGPWGSLLIFGRIGFQQGSPLALFGAFIMIATLAMGPFAQQVISTQQENVPQPDINSTIPIARVYDTGIPNVAVYLINPNNADAAMHGAIFNGLFNLGTPFDFFCPSGNCTWPDFSSLAVCNTCENVSNGTIDREFGKNFTFETPGGIQVKMSGDSDPEWLSYGLVSGNYSRSHSAIAIAQAEGEGVGFEFEPSYNPYSNPNISYRITECNITWCAKLYKNVKAVNGRLADFSIEDIPLQETGEEWDGPDGMYGKKMSPSGSNNTYQPVLPPWGNDSFIVEWPDDESTFKLLLSMFEFETTSSDTRDQYAFTPGHALYKKNVSEVMSNITASMTNRIRHGRNATVAKGVVLKPETIVLVKWNWLILPIALVVLDFVFLAFVICANSSQGAPLWKSGLIPLFFHGLEQSFDSQDKQQQQPRRNRRLETRDEMKEEATRMKVRLRRNQDDRTAFVVL